MPSPNHGFTRITQIINSYPLVPITIVLICAIILLRNFFPPSPQDEFAPRCDFLREDIRRIIYYNMPNGEERDLLTGLFLGERFGISEELLDVLKNTNTMHILAISGLHVGFIGVILAGIFRLMLIPRKLSALLALFGVLLYVSIVGWRPPAFRAAVMFGVLASGWIIDRPGNSINTLALAALVILLSNPQALFQAGFQLSFIIVLCLLLAVSSQKGFKGLIRGSCIAWIGSLPLTAYYFKVISPVAVLANLVVVPGISIVIALGFTSILLGSVYIGISGVFNTASYFLIKGLIGFLGLIADIPYAYFYIRDFPVYLVFLSYLLFFVTTYILLPRRH